MASDKQKIFVFSLLLISFLFYSFYLYTSLPVVENGINEQSSKGKLVWQKYNCNACHQVYGLGGFLGPDLTNEYSKKGEEYIKAFLKNGTVVMPDFHLKENETNELISYLKNIDSTGIADPRTFIINYDGTIKK